MQLVGLLERGRLTLLGLEGRRAHIVFGLLVRALAVREKRPAQGAVVHFLGEHSVLLAGTTAIVHFGSVAQALREFAFVHGLTAVLSHSSLILIFFILFLVCVIYIA